MTISGSECVYGDTEALAKKAPPQRMDWVQYKWRPDHWWGWPWIPIRNLLVFGVKATDAILGPVHTNPYYSRKNDWMFDRGGGYYDRVFDERYCNERHDGWTFAGWIP